MATAHPLRSGFPTVLEAPGGSRARVCGLCSLLADTKEELEARAANANLLQFVNAFRAHGHQSADLDLLKTASPV